MSNNQFFLSFNNQNEIPSLINNSLNENKNEFSEQFLKHLLDYKNIILENSIENENGTSKKKIEPEHFFQNYIEEINNKNTIPNRNKLLFPYEQSEIRLLKLFENLSYANNRYEYYLRNPNEKINETNSELIIVNETIKNSPTLISYIYLLNWLQKIKQNYFNYLSTEKNPLLEKKQFEINPKINYNEKGFDQLNQTEKEKDDNYINFINQITCLIMSDNLFNSQNRIEERNQYYLSSILEGGLPLHDFSIEKINFDKFDIDLIPPYMKNHEFFENIVKRKNDPLLLNNYDNIIIGNNNWILWLFTLYDSCNDNSIHTQFNLLSRLLSGNFNNYYINSQNFDEFLFIKIMNLLNCELLDKIYNNNNNKYINYHFSATNRVNINDLIGSRNGKNIFDVINEIRTSEEYNNLIQKNFSFELELYIIELHFLKIENKYNNDNKIFENIINFFNRIYIQIEKDNFPIYLNENKNDVEINSLEEKNRKTSSIRKLLKITYLKILFSTLISFYDLFIEYFQPNLNQNYLNELQNNYDNIIGQYFNHLTKITRNPTFLIYLFSYMLNFNTIIYYLSNYAKTIEFESFYSNFIEEINKYFQNEKQYLHKSIAEGTDLFNFRNLENKTIDLAINEYVKNQLEGKNYIISNENSLKINQMKNLFYEQKDLNEDLIQQYHLKLCVKFIYNQCYQEAKEILKNITAKKYENQKEQLKIYEYDIERLYEQIMNKKLIIDEFNEYKYKDAIELSTILFQIIVDCFLDYSQIEYEILKSKSILQNQSFKERLYNFIEKKLIPLNTFIKWIIQNNELMNYYSNFYGSVIFSQNFLKILFDWGFQSIKLIIYLFTKRYILFDQSKYNREIYYDGKVAHYIFPKNNNQKNSYFLLAIPYLENKNEIFPNQDYDFYTYLNNNYTLEIYQLLYNLAKINKNYLNSIFTKEIEDSLKKMKKEDIEELDFSIND